MENNEKQILLAPSWHNNMYGHVFRRYIPHTKRQEGTIMQFRSEDIKDLVIALSKAKAEYPSIHPNRRANYGDFADMDHMMSLVQPILTKYGLDLTHQPWEDTDTKKEVLVSILGHSSGQWMQSVIVLKPTDNKSTSYGSALTYAKRYATMALLGINPSKEPTDNDGAEEFITAEQTKKLELELKDRPDIKQRIFDKMKINRLNDIYKNEFEEILGGVIKAKGIPK